MRVRSLMGPPFSQDPGFRTQPAEPAPLAMRLLGPCLLVVCAVLPGLRAQQGKDPLSGGTCYDDIAAHLQTEPAGGVKRRLSKLSRDMTGRVALITGAASGQGDATARVLADAGFSDLNANMAALSRSGGDIGAAMSGLLSPESPH